MEQPHSSSRSWPSSATDIPSSSLSMTAYSPSACPLSSEAKRKRTNSDVGNALILKRQEQKDLECPICLDIIKEAMVTQCGHSFCHICINHHLNNKSNCPVCNTSITIDQVFPNFILNRVILGLNASTHSSRTKSLSDDRFSSITKKLKSSASFENLNVSSSQKWTFGDIDAMLNFLIKQKLEMEFSKKVKNTHILSSFLQMIREDKEKEIEALNRDLTLLIKDIHFLQDKPISITINSEKKSVRQLDPVHVQVPNKICSNVPSSSELNSDLTKPLLENEFTKKLEPDIEKNLLTHYDELKKAYFEDRIKDTQNESLETFSSQLAFAIKPYRLRTISNLFFSDPQGVFQPASSSIVSTIELDKDDEFFAVAGVTKKIKIYELEECLCDYRDRWGYLPDDDLHDIQNNARDENRDNNQYTPDCVPRFPVLEMTSPSKISCLSWNTYIKSRLISSDYDGVITLWDINTVSTLKRWEEHEKRAWSVDFCPMEPSKCASGGDDTRVKIWSMNMRTSISTITSMANVCSVKFHPTIPHYLAFGSADRQIHYYDLRNIQSPLSIFRGHKKSVSYVCFSDENSIISASTDSTLRRWEINPMKMYDQNSSFTLQKIYQGHTNERNFLGLSSNSSGNFFACGSESNEVYIYYKTLTRPVVVHPFGSGGQLLPGERVFRDPSHFVSSVRWRRHDPDILLTANSQGRIKLMELIS